MTQETLSDFSPRKLLLIVDPQIDFVTGSLPVEGAALAMDNLAAYISEHAADYAACIITADWHPFNHCSFKDNGGQWPRHCVAFSTGASIVASVLEAAFSRFPITLVLTKGTDAAKEEYSIFANSASAAVIDRTIHDLSITEIDICGIAGDICVSNTLLDGIAKYGADMFAVLPRFAPSIDNGKQLQEIISQHHLKCNL